MAYFNQNFIDFFKGLAANNSKDYFDEYRKVYIKEVKEPFQALLMDAASSIGEFEPAVKKMELKNSMFRINRDIRFSKDKTPYNLHVSAVVSPYGRKDMQYPGLYIHLSVEMCHLGGGMYMPDKENLSKIRQAIIDDPKAYNKAGNDPHFKKVYGQLVEGDKNKILPKEFKEYGEQYPALFNKQFYYMQEYDGEKNVMREDLLDFVVDHYKAGQSWNKWFKKAMNLK
ncbi:MAG: DUF2461 domain-containing protein [Bacteroidia bacterium]